MKRYSRLERAYHKCKEFLFGLYWLIVFKRKNSIARKDKVNFSTVDLSRIKEIEGYFASNNFDNTEIKSVQNYINEKGITNVFPYDFVYDYYIRCLWKLRYDRKNLMFYIWHSGKRIYLKQSKYEDARSYCINLLCEQNKNSPHKYWEGELSGSYFFDCGAAEGIFAVENMDNFEHIFLFEADESWIPALKKTLAPFEDKVTVIHKFVGNYDSSNNITIDSAIERYNIDIQKSMFIKMDVEGAEEQVLEGMQATLKKASDLRLVICTYHKQDDEYRIKEIIDQVGLYKYEMSKGYMILYYDDLIREPYIRRGVMRVERKER